MLAFAPDFRRLILTFHFIIRFKTDVANILRGATPLPRRIRDSECEKIAAEP
jgi:hypothetical protein